MSEWWTYRPEDFLLFSEGVYWRLFELHNATYWPVGIVALLAGAWILSSLLVPRPGSAQLVGATLAVAWCFVAWAFLWSRYAPINWAATYVAPAFVLQAALLVWAGLRQRIAFTVRGGPGRLVGIGLVVYALAVHPLIAPIAGRPFGGAELFGMAPDPTAIATLGIAAAATGSARWLIVPVPALWGVLSFLTLNTMGTWEGWMPLAAVALGLAALVWPSSSNGAGPATESSARSRR